MVMVWSPGLLEQETWVAAEVPHQAQKLVDCLQQRASALLSDEAHLRIGPSGDMNGRHSRQGPVAAGCKQKEPFIFFRKGGSAQSVLLSQIAGIIFCGGLFVASGPVSELPRLKRQSCREGLTLRCSAREATCLEACHSKAALGWSPAKSNCCQSASWDVPREPSASGCKRQDQTLKCSLILK